jgi:acetyl esterase/lipase
LILLYLLHLRDTSPSTPLPAAAVLYSPCIDMSGSTTRYTPRIKTDYLFSFSDTVPFMNDMLRPEGRPFDTPEISALLAKNVSGLPPQLVYWSQTEVFASESETWIARTRKAGIEVVEHKPTGMLHTYGLGWPFVPRGGKMERECDELLIGFVFSHVS